MAITQANQRAYLEELATELRRRSLRATVTGSVHGVVLWVANPSVRELADSIGCGDSSQGERYEWSWRDEIGPVDRVGEAADRIVDVLCTADGVLAA